MKNQIGYILIQHFSTSKAKICEAPRHKNLNIEAYAVLAIQGSMYPDGLVQMICKDCWNHFDRDMGSPQWNLLENDMSGIK